MQETQAPETVTEDSVFQIGSNQYKVSDLSEESKQHISNVRVAETKKQEALTTAQLLDIAANTMMSQLRESLSDTPHTVVESPAEKEETAE